jgi:hypothetical protein
MVGKERGVQTAIMLRGWWGGLCIDCGRWLEVIYTAVMVHGLNI